MGVYAGPGSGIGHRSLTLTLDFRVEISVIADDGKATRDDRVCSACEVPDPGGERAGERVAENEESVEPDRLYDRDQIVGQVADPIGSIGGESAAGGEAAWARSDNREAFGERAEIEVIRPGEVQMGQQQCRPRSTYLVAQLQAVADKRRHRAASLLSEEQPSPSLRGHSGTGAQATFDSAAFPFHPIRLRRDGNASSSNLA